MQNYGRSTISDFLGDRVLYRNLKPFDPRLPTAADIRKAVGLDPDAIPRKSQPAYGRLVAYLLEAAAPAHIKRLLFVGDTRLLDGTAFDNICAAGGWPGLAFIGSEDSQLPRIQVVSSPGGNTLYLSNRWAALPAFGAYAQTHGFPIDEDTAVVFDIDKTTLGARGRNAHVIDQARVQAVQDTVALLLGKAFDLSAFRKAYDTLNQPEFHTFTGDNQDYLAYICLVLGGGLFELDNVVVDARSGALDSFETFIARADARRGDLSPELGDIHAEIFGLVLDGDPTPFKAFRRAEFLTTIGRMGHLSDNASMESLLDEEILLTQEVRALALDCYSRGALPFGLSDKPDEASVPTSEQVVQGYQPIHRTPTHAVGV
jgi:hypothetical protein